MEKITSYKLASLDILSVIKEYNRVRKDLKGTFLKSSELKTTFEKIGLPFSQYWMPSYLKYNIIEKKGYNKYTLPSKPVYYGKLAVAMQNATVINRAA